MIIEYGYPDFIVIIEIVYLILFVSNFFYIYTTTMSSVQLKKIEDRLYLYRLCDDHVRCKMYPKSGT